jgi:hypothetical protein
LRVVRERKLGIEVVLIPAIDEILNAESGREIAFARSPVRDQLMAPVMTAPVLGGRGHALGRMIA